MGGELRWGGKVGVEGGVRELKVRGWGSQGLGS